jgi:uncharacterized protein (TIGR00369 family)
MTIENESPAADNPARLAAHVSQIIMASMPSSTRFGFRIDHIAPPEVICTLPFQEKQTRPGNTISGPTLMTLADLAMYALVLGLDQSQVMAVTQDLHMHFLARPAPQDLQAVGTVVKHGRRSVVMRVDLYSVAPEGSKKLVAFATGTYALMAKV